MPASGRGCERGRPSTPGAGSPNAYRDARAEDWAVNHKKIQRLWREEGLRVPHRRRRNGALMVDFSC